MSQASRTAKRAGKVILQLYRELQPTADRQTEKHGPSTCREGCAHCCRLQVIASVPEMIPVAEYVTSRADWPERREPLRRATIEYLRKVREHGISGWGDAPERLSWWHEQIACPFLNSNERCDVYSVRPGTCRWHIAVTPAEKCAHVPGAALQPVIARVDLRPLEEKIAVDGAVALGRFEGGAIAAAFVRACRLIGVPFDVPDDLVSSGMILDEGLPV